MPLIITFRYYNPVMYTQTKGFHHKVNCIYLDFLNLAGFMRRNTKEDRVAVMKS